MRRTDTHEALLRAGIYLRNARRAFDKGRLDVYSRWADLAADAVEDAKRSMISDAPVGACEVLPPVGASGR